jgi:hypothetical protein
MNVLKKLTGYKQSLDKPELRPKAVLLDVNGTLFAATAAAPAFKELGLDEGLVEVRQLRTEFDPNQNANTTNSCLNSLCRPSGCSSCKLLVHWYLYVAAQCTPSWTDIHAMRRDLHT